MCPPLVCYPGVAEYKRHYERVYCRAPILTFDGIPVYFRKSRFRHVFYESSKRNRTKDRFSRVRAERIDWIRATLQDSNATLYQGWDAAKARYDPDTRVSVAYDAYIVIIRVVRTSGKASVGEFRTAFVADNSISKIRKSPLWA